MKKVNFQLITLLMVLFLGMTACTKDGAVGPAGKDGTDGMNGADGTNGKDGEDGADGEDGEDGNANVRLYTFDAGYNWATTFEYSFECPSDQDTSVNSLWLAYIVNSSDYVYNLPGKGTASATTYRCYRYDGSTMVNYYITVGEGPGETYEEVRIFRVYANIAGRNINNIYNGFTEEEVRAMSYEAFCMNFHIQP